MISSFVLYVVQYYHYKYKYYVSSRIVAASEDLFISFSSFMIILF